jgi:hypothetical protein
VTSFAAPRRLTEEVALLALALVAIVVWQRTFQPFAIEVLEEGVASMAVRVVEAGIAGLYTAPTADFVPLLYGPLHPVLGAALFETFYAELWVLRAASLVAFVLLVGAVHAIARASSERLTGLVACGVLAATYPWSGYWFELARVDTVFLMLTFLAVLAGVRGHGWSAGIAAGLAILTKQSAVPIVVALGVGCLLVDRRRGGKVLAGALAVGIAPLVALHVVSDGWSTFYLWTMPGQHPLDPALLGEIVTGQWPLLPAVVLAAIGARAQWRRGRAAWPLLFALGGAIAMAVAARIRVGGSDNVLMPAHVAIALLAANGYEVVAARRPWLAFVLVLAPFVALAASVPRAFPADDARGYALKSLLASIDEPVFAPTRPFLSWQLGNGLQADGTAAWDVLRSTRADVATPLRDGLIARMRDGSQRAMLVSGDAYAQIVGDLYPRVLPAFRDGGGMGVSSFDGEERLVWMLKADDDDLARRVQASWGR